MIFVRALSPGKKREADTTQVGSVFALLALIFGAIKLRFSFLLATVFSSLSAVLLLMYVRSSQ